jgi:tetratricopeptide (TPR) repeat protein
LSCREIAIVQHSAHQDDEALKSIQRSLDVLKVLVRAQPDQASYHSELGLSWNYLGVLYDESRKNTEALAAFEQAVAEQHLAVAKAKEADEYRGFLANHLDNLGEANVDLGRVDQGLIFFRRSLQICRDLSAAHPQNRDYALWAVKSLIRLGTIQRHNGDSAAARESYAHARTILEHQSGTAPEDAVLRILLGAVFDQEANALFDQGRANEAKELLERAVLLLRPRSQPATSASETAQDRQKRGAVLYVLGLAADAGDAGTLERGWRSEALWDLARVLRAQKLFAEADKADSERLAIWSEPPPNELVNLAFRLLERAIVIGYGKTPVPDRARTIRDLELDQAAQCIRLAISRGFNDLRKLCSHPDATFLLSREDVKPLIMDLALPDRPFGGTQTK